MRFALRLSLVDTPPRCRIAPQREVGPHPFLLVGRTIFTCRANDRGAASTNISAVVRVEFFISYVWLQPPTRPNEAGRGEVVRSALQDGVGEDFESGIRILGNQKRKES